MNFRLQTSELQRQIRVKWDSGLHLHAPLPPCKLTSQPRLDYVRWPDGKKYKYKDVLEVKEQKSRWVYLQVADRWKVSMACQGMPNKTQGSTRMPTWHCQGTVPHFFFKLKTHWDGFDDWIVLGWIVLGWIVLDDWDDLNMMIPCDPFHNHPRGWRAWGRGRRWDAAASLKCLWSIVKN